VEKNKIGHIVLNTEHFSLQGEDADAGTVVTTGNNNKLVLEFRDLEKTQQVFQALAKDGSIVCPLEKTFFTEAIGELVDKFGIRWIIMMTNEDYTD
jgi:PhnB protein